MQIESGKFYRTRDGRRVGPTKESKFAPFVVPQGLWYRANGHQSSLAKLDGLSPHDLVAEWGDEPVAADTPATTDALISALAPLVAIADAFDANELDDEARRCWGVDYEHENARDPTGIELYAGRGGKRLLTLADCIAARDAMVAAREVRS